MTVIMVLLTFAIFLLIDYAWTEAVGETTCAASSES